jgi:hypothetical protein
LWVADFLASGSGGQDNKSGELCSVWIKTSGSGMINAFNNSHTALFAKEL